MQTPALDAMVALAPESILLLQSTACQPLVPAGKGCRLHEGSKRSVRANAQKGARKNGYFSDADPNGVRLYLPVPAGREIVYGSEHTLLCLASV